MISKQKEIFNKLADKRLEEMTELDKKFNPDHLIFKYKGPAANAKFNKFDNALSIIDKIREDIINENDQIKFKSDLSEIKKGNKKYRSREQRNTIERITIEMIYKANNVIKFYDDYSSMVSEAKHEATKGTELKMLTSKQMPQRFPISVVQVKAGNNSENLLNEIRQIVYSLYQSKEITKKVYNNMIKSMQI